MEAYSDPTTSGLQMQLDKPTAKPCEAIPSRPIEFVWHFVRRGFLRVYGGMFLLAALAAALEATVPFLLGNSVSEVIRREASTGRFLWSIVILALVWLGAIACDQAHVAWDRTATPRFREFIQKSVFDHCIGHAASFFERHMAGRVGQRIKDAGRSSVALTQMVVYDFTKTMVTVITTIALLVGTRQFILAGGLFVWLVVFISVSGFLAKRCQPLVRSFSSAASASAGAILDSITNNDTVRSNWRFDTERLFVGRALECEANANIQSRHQIFLLMTGQALGKVLLVAMVLASAGFIASTGREDAGTLATAVSLSLLLINACAGLSRRILDAFQALATLQESLSIVAEPRDIVDAPEAGNLSIIGGSIEFADVSFRYPGAKTNVLERLSVVIAPGTKVGIVGPSGAGKSTLLKLMRRSYNISEGSIMIDGQDIRRVTLQSLNNAIAYVSQTPEIFHRTLRENVTYSRPTAYEREIIEALDRSFSSGFVRSKSAGLDTIAGDRGVALSGGERQRITIARALLKGAPILLLDEATSSLDSQSEYFIQKAFEQVFRGRTVIAIAHRLSTIRNMDRILYLENGKIIEDGSHDELLILGGQYATLWKKQISGFLGERLEGVTPTG